MQLRHLKTLLAAAVTGAVALEAYEINQQSTAENEIAVVDIENFAVVSPVACWSTIKYVFLRSSTITIKICFSINEQYHSTVQCKNWPKRLHLFFTTQHHHGCNGREDAEE